MLIDRGAYTTWVEDNGLEMVAESKREVVISEMLLLVA
jgi:hypothetical protein